MRKIFALIILSIFLPSCDDGDVITLNLDFNDSFSTCGDLVIYKLKNDPAETLSISLSNVKDSDLTDFPDELSNASQTDEITATINGSTNKLNYRRYNQQISGNELFCNAVPNDIDIILDDESSSGEVIISKLVIEDDNDGIPAEDEDENTDGDNNPATNPTDTDQDGIPNYLDIDDDGDNVLTKDEDLNEDEDNNPATNPLDSDGDSIPNYLDNDDDGDGVKTRDEENEIQDQNPLNDETNTNEGPDFLNPNVATTVPATSYKAHTVVRNFTISVVVKDITLTSLSQQTYDFGSIERSETIDKETIFN